MWWSLQRRHCSIHIRGLNKKEHMVPLDLHISRNFLSLSGDNLKPNLKTDTQMLTLKFLTYSNWNYFKNSIYHFLWKKPNSHLSLPLVFSILLTILKTPGKHHTRHKYHPNPQEHCALCQNSQQEWSMHLFRRWGGHRGAIRKKQVCIQWEVWALSVTSRGRRKENYIPKIHSWQNGDF